MSKQSDMEGTKRLIAALGRMPPKQHKDMKLGKPRGKRAFAVTKLSLTKTPPPADKT